MDTERLGRSRLMNLIFRSSGRVMESRLRGRLFDAGNMLWAGGVAPGRTVLEVGCGSGFFTLPAAGIVGARGRLIAIEPLTSFVERVRTKVREAGLSNVEVRQRDALDTGLDDASIDVALLYGVVPFPTLPLDRLLPEMHRVLKPGGTLAVWLFPISFGVPTIIRRSGLFTPLGKKDGVYTYERI
jgi:demethylmenaquinone methyltransferase/2-methoxy-6-polyprenyl-1,4-benzoquinol methylase